MATESVTTDRGVGLTVLFVVVGIAGAVVAFVAGLTENQILASWGFAAAMIAGSLAVGAVHLAR
ncbi:MULTISPECIES: DUF7525 family protein [Halococcus]|uniref:DUF7525 family protein n=1 Tax=Halococcus TaxID=2249 RepID=UPI000E75BEB8|nr:MULTISPECIES: hypothetical protein [Halococcus]RJS98154.1 hypothetical protein D3261_17460 [Halococcus sp. IIIV-5B]